MLNQKLMGKVGEDKTYIEDVFSTYLYTGNGSTQTINNGIDLAGKGGMVWLKSRTQARAHHLFDTARGVGNEIYTNSTAAQANYGHLTSFNSNGFSLSSGIYVNNASEPFASWTFRKAPKFFDVVTYTGNGAGSQPVAHSLGSKPGFIVCKATSTTDNWAVYHRGNGTTEYTQLSLNLTNAAGFAGALGTVNATTFNAAFIFDSAGVTANASGVTYVAYLFAHDTDTDGLIQCGSYTGTGAELNVNLGWEPQYLMVKRTDSAANWFVIDNMRGMAQTSSSLLIPNLTNAESSGLYVTATATGFTVQSPSPALGASGGTYIYMAIRRGPMRTPTDGTKVFSPSVYTGTLTTANPNTRVLEGADLWLNLARTGASAKSVLDRLRGWNYLYTNTNAAEVTTYTWTQPNQTTLTPNTSWWGSSTSQLDYYFKRAPGFFDVVCYTGTGSAMTVNHNLGVAPELMIVKRRSSTGNWYVYSQSVGVSETLLLNSTDAKTWVGAPWWQDPTSMAFYMYNFGTSGMVTSGVTYISYLFASCPGVSKVGSYTGNGSSQTINCGFTNGARFFLVKSTSTSGNWWVYDSARGIVSSTDPVLALNSTAAEVTSADAVDPDSTGIIVNQEATCSINASGVSYIYLAIA